MYSIPAAARTYRWSTYSTPNGTTYIRGDQVVQRNYDGVYVRSTMTNTGEWIGDTAVFSTLEEALRA